MSENQPWNVSGFNPMGSSGVQMFDPTNYQTNVGASLTNPPGGQKLYNPAEFQPQTGQDSGLPSDTVEPAHSQTGFPQGNAGPQSWANGGNQWQPANSYHQQEFSNDSLHSQNFFSPGNNQQWQNWNPQQPAQPWDGTQQQQQNQSSQNFTQQSDAVKAQTSEGQQWSQPSDPVWSEPEPWLNENSSWGGQPNDTQGQFNHYQPTVYNQPSSSYQPFANDSNNPPFAVNSSNSQFAVSSSNQTFDVNSSNETFTVNSSNQSFAVSSSNQHFGGDSSNPLPAVSSSSQQTPLGLNNQPNTDSSSNQQTLPNNSFPYSSPDSSWDSGAQMSAQQSFNPPSVNANTGQAQEFGANVQSTVIPTFDVNLNDSGTVSSFFGSDDIYEPSTNVKPEDKSVAPPSSIPSVLRVPSFNRTASEISNSSLVTCHNSSLDSLEGDNIQDVQDISNLLQNTSLNDNQTSEYQSTQIPPPDERILREEDQFSPDTMTSSGASTSVNTFISSQNTADNISIQSNDSLSNSFNQSGLGSYSHHSSLDSGDLGLGSGLSSGPGTPGRPSNPSHSQQQQHNTDSLMTSTHEVRSQITHPSNSVIRNLNESLQGFPQHEAPPVHGPPVATDLSSKHPGLNWNFGSSQQLSHSTVTSGAGNQAASDSHSVLDTSGSSGLNTSSDTITARPSSAFKPLTKSPATSRQSSFGDSSGNLPDGSLSRKPPRPPSEGREYIPYRPHSRQKHRSDNNVSPATTLWAPPDSSFHAPVILAPAAPTPLTSPSHKAKPESVLQPVSNQPRQMPETKPEDLVHNPGKIPVGKTVSSIQESPRRNEFTEPKSEPQSHDNKPRRKRRSRRLVSRDENVVSGAKVDPDATDRPASRNDSLTDEINPRPRSRNNYERSRSRTDYDRPSSRSEYDRPSSRSGYDRQNSHTDYERPRSRSGYERPSSRSGYERPSSRSGYERPSSRSGYERSEYDRYYDRDYRSNHKGYDYDQYYRRGYYDRDYYDYYQNRYALGYYDEYYRQAYENRYQPGYYTESVVANTETADNRSQYSGTSRGNTPAEELDQSAVDREPQGYGSRPGSRQERYGHYDDQAYAQMYEDYYRYHQGYGYGHYEEYAKPEAVAKFSLPHVGVSFSPSGHMILIQPSRPKEGQPALIQVHELEMLLQDDEEVEEIEEFPGPLVKGETHKNDVLALCQKRARQCKEDVELIDRDSAELLWRFLELLIKQNGTVVGTDISDLLLEGHEPTTLEYKSSGVKISTSQSQSMENLGDIMEDDTEKTLAVAADRSVVNRRRSITVEDVTDRFRHLLLYGRKKDSLDWAMKHNLWGHALFLASKMDTRTHANVMIRFANSSMRMNDPLQTLYQLMSGRQPAAVTCISDERWGDWRPHLAMILSNNSPKPDIDRKSIITLGDTLASRGYLYASHFCYLMAQVSLGTYNKKSSKLVLVGTSHNLPFDEFSTNEAIQCTEVYEYALQLGNPLSTLPTFQPYKYMYASRMAEFGLSQKALHYCEVISATVNQAPGLYPYLFVKQLYEMSCRLKYSDPQRHEMGFELEDPYWLQQLQRSCQGLEDGSIQPISGTATPVGYSMTTPSSESGEIVGLTSAAEMTYGQYTEGEEGAYQPGYTADQWGQQQQYDQEGGEGVTGEANTVPYQQYTADQPQGTEGHYDPSQYNQGYNYGYQQQQMDGTYNYSTQPGFNEQRNSIDSTDTGADAGFVGDPLSYGARRYSISNNPIPHVPEEATADTTDGNIQANPGTDYWGASTQNTQKVYGGPSFTRQRTTSGGSSMSSGRHRTMSGSSSHSIKASPYTNKQQPTVQPSHRSKDKSKKSGASAGGQGILGFIVSKLPFSTPKNEMKLPKDEKPAIIWDPVKNRWVNTDGDEEEETPSGPPPTDTELTAPTQQPSVGGPEPMQGNRFQRPKTRGARNRYVDVLNPGGSSTSTSSSNVPTSLFNVMPNSTPQNIFIPGSVPESSSQTAVGGEITNASQHPAPANPTPIHTLDTPQTGKEHSRSSSLSSLSREVQQFTQQAIAQAEQDALQDPISNPGVPMMFNPSSFNQNQQNTNQSANTSGPRYGQRRQYPKRS